MSGKKPRPSRETERNKMSNTNIMSVMAQNLLHGRKIFHEIRPGNRIFLVIESPDCSTLEGQREAAKAKYSVEREISYARCTAEIVASLVHEMERESGIRLFLSDILADELGLPKNT